MSLEIPLDYDNIGVRGNPNLKRPNSVDYVTKDEYNRRIQEIIRCKNDIVYFANNYYHIISPGKGLHQIVCYKKQEELLRYFVENDRCIVLSARQSSKTTSYAIFSLWYTIFNPEKRVLIAANKRDTAIEVLTRIQLGYENLPNWIKPGLETWNKGEIIFSNRSSIKGVATGSDAARGMSANCVDGSSTVTIRNKITGIIETITMIELYNRLSLNNTLNVILKNN